MTTESSLNPYRAQASNNSEIDLMVLTKIIWKGRKTIMKCLVVAGVLGIVIALLLPKEYTARTSMVPQTSQSGSKLGGLSSLAAMAGFDLDMTSSGDALSPLVYPQIVNSVTFQMELMNTPFTISGVNHPVSLYEYYSKIKKPGVLSLIGKYTIGLPGVILSAIRGEVPVIHSDDKGPITLTKEQEEVRKLIEEKVELDLDSKNGYLTLSASFPEALLSAQVANQARELLQQYITRFKIEKASAKLAFIEERYQEKKKEFEKSQVQLAVFRDQNRNVSSALAHTTEERMQSEYSITMNVFNELAKQLEQAKEPGKGRNPGVFHSPAGCSSFQKIKASNGDDCHYLPLPGGLARGGDYLCKNNLLTGLNRPGIRTNALLSR